MEQNTWNIVLMVVAGVSFLAAIATTFSRPVYLHVTLALVAAGLLFWSLVPLIEFIRLA